MEKSINILANALYLSQSNLPSFAPITFSLLINNISNTLSIFNLNIRIMNIELELGDVKSIFSRILAVVSEKTTIRNENESGNH